MEGYRDGTFQEVRKRSGLPAGGHNEAGTQVWLAVDDRQAGNKLRVFLLDPSELNPLEDAEVKLPPG
jgi:hypothetical protein